MVITEQTKVFRTVFYLEKRTNRTQKISITLKAQIEEAHQRALGQSKRKRNPSTNPGKKPTRVLQRFPTGGEFEVDEKTNELNQNYFEVQDSTACLFGKEQELKPSGRLFVKQPYRQRLDQTAMENNISKQFMRYVPEQTMTEDLLKQQEDKNKIR